MQVVAPKLDHGMVGKFEVSEGRGWIFKGAGWKELGWEGMGGMKVLGGS